jgi:hypothetical protein
MKWMLSTTGHTLVFRITHRIGSTLASADSSHV